MQKRQVFISIILIGIVVLIGIGGSKFFASMKKETPIRTPREIPKYVKAEPVIYGTHKTSIIATGRVTTSQPVSVIAEVQGKILPGQVPLKSGQQFSKGQLLFKMYDTDARLTLHARKSSFLNRLALILPDIKLDFKDNFEAWNTYFLNFEIEKPIKPLPDFGSVQEKTFIAGKNILTDYYNILSDEEKLKKYAVYAPYSGTFSKVYLEVGSAVNPGTRIAEIVKTGHLDLVVPVERKDIEFFSIGSGVQIKGNTGEGLWQGSVTRISEVINPQTQSFDVFISINSDLKLPVFDGMYMTAHINGKSINQVMEVSRRAIYDNERVYLVKSGKLKTAEINILFTSKETALINGLKEGDTIVIESLANVTENMPINMLAE